MHCSKQRPLCDALLGFHNPWQSDREGRPAAWLALDRDVATHHLTKAPANGEAKASSAVLAVAEEACENSCNSLPICSGAIPMPVSV